jgi:hypothetical protein
MPRKLTIAKTLERNAKVLAEYAEGKTPVVKLCRKHQIDKKTLYALIEKNGISIRKPRAAGIHMVPPDLATRAREYIALGYRPALGPPCRNCPIHLAATKDNTVSKVNLVCDSCPLRHFHDRANMGEVATNNDGGFLPVGGVGRNVATDWRPGRGAMMG